MSFKGKAFRFLNNLAPEGLTTFVINQVIGDYGKMIEFKFDPKEKYMHAKALLVGEEQPIEFEISDYELNREGDQLEITLRAANCNREWLNILLQKQIIGRPLKVPADKAGFVFDILKP